MNLLPSFQQSLQAFSCEMSSPAFRNFSQIIAGWIFAAHHTIAGALLSSGVAGTRHHSAFYRTFSEDVWDCDQVGWNLAESLIQRHLLAYGSNRPIDILIDDTNTKKSGRKIHGTAWHYDSTAKTAGKKKSTWANNWVVLAILTEPFLESDKRVAMTVQTRMYVPPKCVDKYKLSYRNKLQLSKEMVRTLCEKFPELKFRLLTDAAYGVGEMLKDLPSNCVVVSRLRCNARLYQTWKPVSETGQKTGPGRPRKHGERLPKASEIFEKRGKTCRTLTIYGKRKKLEWVTFRACLYQSPGCELRVVVARLVDDESGKTEPIVTFYSTNPKMGAAEVIELYCKRWAIEETFQEAKEHLGLEEPQCRSRKAVERIVPSILYLHTILWKNAGEESLERQAAARKAPWNRSTVNLSLGDIISILREKHLEEIIKSSGVEETTLQKITRPLASLIRAA